MNNLNQTYGDWIHDFLFNVFKYSKVNDEHTSNSQSNIQIQMPPYESLNQYPLRTQSQMHYSKQYQCQSCPKRYSYRSDLRKHETDKHGRKQKWSKKQKEIVQRAEQMQEYLDYGYSKQSQREYTTTTYTPMHNKVQKYHQMYSHHQLQVSRDNVVMNLDDSISEVVDFEIELNELDQ